MPQLKLSILIAMTFLHYATCVSKNELIDEAYKTRGAVYLAVNRKGICYWANSRGAYMNIQCSP